MRLIDADALSAQAEYDSIFRLIIPYHRLANAPTIEAEPVVHAHWIYGKWDPIHCSNCGEALRDLFRDCILMREPRRCPYCGAHMGEEVPENDG